MDKVWRFFRTVGWSSVGLVFVGSLIAVVNSINEGDYIGAKTLAAVGLFTVIGSGIVAIIQAALTQTTTQTSPAYRAVSQFLQVLVAGVPAPFFADTFLDTATSYGEAWIALVGVAIAAGLQSFVVNQREADPTAVTPLAVEDTPANQ